VALLRSIRTTLEMIKWEHSVFALPFALAGAMLAAGGWPTPRQLLWIVVAMVAARSAAMAFNRLADHALDAANPRTATRALPAGRLTRGFVVLFVVAASLLLVLAAWQLNRLAFYLSPLALAIVFFYSLTKRFTRWSHFFLGFALGVAPAAAWIAVRGALDLRILLLTAAVTCWVAGFDVLYACQDYDFDRQAGLHSIPRWAGIPRSLLIARGLHAAMPLLLYGLVVAFGLGKLMVMGIVVVALLLAYEHSLLRPHDLRRLDAAFFTMNGVISLVFFCFVALDLTWLRR
jgi:4-hydroxybenzoate polyprenyltransferase